MYFRDCLCIILTLSGVNCVYFSHYSKKKKPASGLDDIVVT